MLRKCMTSYAIWDRCRGSNLGYFFLIRDFIIPENPKANFKLGKTLAEKVVQILDWSAQSPDLNPVDHLWHHLKRRLETYPDAPRSRNELWEQFQE